MAANRRTEKLKEVMNEYAELSNQLSCSKDMGDQMYYRLCFDPPKSDKEWMNLHDQVYEYLTGEHPEEKKNKLRQYTEMLAMMKNGYDKMRKGSNGKG